MRSITRLLVHCLARVPDHARRSSLERFSQSRPRHGETGWREDRHAPARKQGLHLRIALLSAALAACDAPNVDAFRADGGAAPDPTGVIEGTVLYVGPRPACERAGEWMDGEPVRVRGAVILTLFEYDNPPPPNGSASGAVSLLTVPGEAVFGLEDCMPLEPTAEALRPIMRSAPFTWPEIALGRDPCTEVAGSDPICPGQSYQVRGFYDYDGDFNPFFGVRNLPTAGDIGGGAFVSTSAVPPVPLEIHFGHITQELDGQVVQGVAVTLGAPVNTERPIFEVLDQTRAMSSSETLPLGSNPVAREMALAGMTNMRLTAIVGGMSGRTELSEPWINAMIAGGIDPTHYRVGVPQYGFYLNPVDANNDGRQDSHPILGTAGIAWWNPVIIVRRAKNPIETRLGVPDVTIVGSIRPTLIAGLSTEFVTPRVVMDFDAVIPPIAVMFTNPSYPAICRMPIIPPGNYEEAYERIWVDCQDLPTGNYDINVLNGVAGGRPVEEMPRCMEACVASCVMMGTEEAMCRSSCTTTCSFTAPRTTQSGWVIEGGSFSSQAWTIPNQLGCPDALYGASAVNQLDRRLDDGTLPLCDLEGAVPEGSLMLASQSRTAAWSIVDPDPPFDAQITDPIAQASASGHAIPLCTRASPQAGGPPREVSYLPPPVPECCPPTLDRFCGLPLCPLRTADTTPAIPAQPAARGLGLTRDQIGAATYPYPQAVRPHGPSMSRATREIRVEGEDYRIEPNGTITPLCTPFLMPVACCEIAATR